MNGLELNLLLAAFGLGLSVAAPLGPVSAAAIREGMERGTASAFLIGLGAATVDFLYLALVYAGVAPLLLRLPLLITGFYLAGALLLGRMAWGAVRRAREGALPGAPGTGPGAGAVKNAFLYGLGLTLLNPATIASWLAMGGAFAAAYLTGLTLPMVAAVLLAVFAGSAAWFLLLALAVGGARRVAGGRPWVFRAVNLAAGLALAGYAVLFLIKAGRG